MDVHEDYQLHHRLAKTKLILHMAPFPSLAEEQGRERYVLADEPDFGQPNDVVSEVVNETADNRDNLQNLDIEGHLVVFYDLVHLFDLVQPEKQPENFTAV